MSWEEIEEGLDESLRSRGAFLDPAVVERYLHLREVPGDPELDLPLESYVDPASGIDLPLGSAQGQDEQAPVEVELPGGIELFGGYYSDQLSVRRELAIGAAEREAEVRSPPTRSWELSRLLSGPRLQGARATCTAFACLALAELYLARQNAPEDLSEQRLHFDFYEHSGFGHRADRGLVLKAAVPVLRDGTVVPERVWPYISSHNEVNALVDECEDDPKACRYPPYSGQPESQYRFVGSFPEIGERDFVGARNHRLLEVLISEGFPIVIDLRMAGAAPDGIWRPIDTDTASRHAVLLWGYDARRQIFAAKDSGVRGGLSLWSYEFIYKNAKYAVVFDGRIEAL